jgi:hypothetical protein
MMSVPEATAMTVSLTKLTDAISEKWKDDPSCPSLVLSSIGRGEYYAAVHRFAGRYGEGKLVVANAKGSTLASAVHVLAEKLLEGHGIVL